MGMPPWDPQLLLGGARANLHLPEPSCSPGVTTAASPAQNILQRVTTLCSTPSALSGHCASLRTGRDLSGVSTGATWGRMPVTPPSAQQHSTDVTEIPPQPRSATHPNTTPPALCNASTARPQQQCLRGNSPSLLPSNVATSLSPALDLPSYVTPRRAARRLPRSIGTGKWMSWPQPKPT